MAPSRVAGGLSHSSSSSGIFFQGDGNSQTLGNSHLGSSFGNSSNSIPGAGRSNLVPVSGDASNTILNSVASSGPSVGASSLVTDANSGLSGGPHLQRSASINGESYMRLPASPLSFSSNNITSGSSVMDGSSVVQQSSNHDPNSQQIPQLQQGNPSATSLPTSRMGQVSLPNGPRVHPGSFTQDPNNIPQLQKKPRLDIKQEDIMQQQVMQHLLQRQDSMQLQNHNPQLQNHNQLQAFLQQQRLRQQQQQQQQFLQSMPPVQRAHLLQQQQQQQQQLQLRQQLQQQGMQPMSSMKRPYDNGVCSRRLMQYLYHQRQRPPANAIAYWRKFVTEYYSPRAKKRWCLSRYDNVGHHSLGVFPQATMVSFFFSNLMLGSVTFVVQNLDGDLVSPSRVFLLVNYYLETAVLMIHDCAACFASFKPYVFGCFLTASQLRNISALTHFTAFFKFIFDLFCGGSWMFTEATYEVLPRLNEIKFGSGVIDELLFLDLPSESRFPSGIMMLDYGKAVQESVYEQLRVIREGQLRIIFTADLKVNEILSELLPRRLVAPQVNQLLQVAQKCQNTISESGSDGVSQQDLQSNSNMVVTAGRQLARTLELQSLNDLGFSKRYVRCLQISEVVNSMKDLMDYCRDQKIGPIEGLKSYPRHATATKLQMQKMQDMEQIATIQGLPTDRNTLNKLLSLNPGLNSQMRNNPHVVGQGAALSGSAQAALALTSYQNMLMRQNSMNSNSNSVQQEASSSFNNPNQNPSPSTFQTMQNSPVSGISNTQVPEQQRPMNGNGLLQQSLPQPPQGNQNIPQHMIQQLLQGMSNNNSGGANANGIVTREGLGFGSNASAGGTAATVNAVKSSAGPTPSRSNSFKAASNSDSSAAGGNNGFNQKTTNLPQNLHLSEEMVPDIGHEFPENGFFSSDLDDYGFNWKG
ncbi:hypothetical protein RHGRI_027816 [Rhododendron griersonianum]|uniref:Transcriptional regulator SLK2 n=1 Tax=Rhododendron griersonianum TaxID=479676 RepID=A0AAV6J1H7_9ERIC|nr:hypothetical protein RHGRI_027816 [Rhododendron griersonianum]